MKNEQSLIKNTYFFPAINPHYDIMKYIIGWNPFLLQIETLINLLIIVMINLPGFNTLSHKIQIDKWFPYFISKKKKSNKSLFSHLADPFFNIL